MASDFGPDETGKTGPDRTGGTGGGDEDLERRRRQLEATLAARRPADRDEGEGARAENSSALAQGLKFSSEFIAGIVVGAVIGWVIDHWAGTSPWGLIVFFFLGFAAGVLNLLRSAGMVAQHGSKPPAKGGPS